MQWLLTCTNFRRILGSDKKLWYATNSKLIHFASQDMHNPTLLASEPEWATALGKDSENHRVKGPNECSVSIHLLQNNIQVYTCAIDILLRYNLIAKYKLKHTSTACLSPPYFCMGCRNGLLDVWLWWGQPGAADEEQPQAWQAEQDLHYPPPWRSCESASNHLHPMHSACVKCLLLASYPGSSPFFCRGGAWIRGYLLH